MAGRPLTRIGHKGADAIVSGNTIASFEAAVEVGVDVIELDVLRPRGDFAIGSTWRSAPAGPARGSGPLLVAHDWAIAERGDPPSLAAALDAFTRAPLDRVQIDCDLKVAGREDEVVSALRDHGLIERAMVSTMEVRSLVALREIAPELRRGWTYPRITRRLDRRWWARPFVLVALAAMRRRLPSFAPERFAELGAERLWVYNRLVTPRLVQACAAAGVELYAWTVDELERMRELRDLGVDGIVTNDPRLFGRL